MKNARACRRARRPIKSGQVGRWQAGPEVFGHPRGVLDPSAACRRLHAASRQGHLWVIWGRLTPVQWRVLDAGEKGRPTGVRRCLPLVPPRGPKLRPGSRQQGWAVAAGPSLPPWALAPLLSRQSSPTPGPQPALLRGARCTSWPARPPAAAPLGLLPYAQVAAPFPGTACPRLLAVSA